MLLPGLDLQNIARFPGTLGIFQHLSAKYGWRPKKSYHLMRRAPGSAPYDKSGPGYCITFNKRLDEGLK